MNLNSFLKFERAQARECLPAAITIATHWEALGFQNSKISSKGLLPVTPWNTKHASGCGLAGRNIFSKES
ncbi:hypothetical protein SKAU_G00129880 [Synaphobranchus kaupii]|uniref:Uncharacterized protein n=1 Tax=Synaphobranchus kaupii TaxID=118154 RepID=A0A9Q1J137_SYNKA|nr:hypothetical protein SKAU_G00129880 [Synaphobranchus kaupii]